MGLLYLYLLLFQVNLILIRLLINPPVITALGFRSVNRRLFATVSCYLHAQLCIIIIILGTVSLLNQ
jgi:hypothetical protein